MSRSVRALAVPEGGFRRIAVLRLSSLGDVVLTLPVVHALRAAFPADALTRRRAVMADLYGPAADLAGDAACLDSLGVPVYVLYRDEDFTDVSPWAALDADSVRFERVYDAGGRRVYRKRAS